MGDLPAGLYEHLLTAGLERRLSSTREELLQLGDLDPADAYDTLTRHIAELARRALRLAGGDGEAGLSRQVELANGIVKAISALAPAATDGGDAVKEPPQTLLAVAQPSLDGAR